MVDCIIFSTGRAASTSIYRYLDEMCDLNLPANKEPHYWLQDALEYKGVPEILGKIYISDSRDYEALYQSSRLSVDASVGYYHYAEKVIARLRQAEQLPKILMLIREPISWARSLYVENLYQGLERASSLASCLRENRTDPNLWWQLRYRDIRYREVFQAVAAVFPEVMLVDYDDFRDDVSRVMRAICQFLNLNVIAEASGEVHHSSLARVNQMRVTRFDFVGRRLPSAIRQPVARLVKRLPLRKSAFLHQDCVREAMLESAASYDQLWEIVSRRDWERRI